MSSPCKYCGVNAWTNCKHRLATMTRPPEPEPEPARDRATLDGGGRYRTHPHGAGLNFHRRKSP
jgi:hypothetical protein